MEPLCVLNFLTFCRTYWRDASIDDIMSELQHDALAAVYQLTNVSAQKQHSVRISPVSAIEQVIPEVLSNGITRFAEKYEFSITHIDSHAAPHADGMLPIHSPSAEALLRSGLTLDIDVRAEVRERKAQTQNSPSNDDPDDIPFGDDYCPQCGAPLGLDNDGEVMCYDCGWYNDEDWDKPYRDYKEQLAQPSVKELLDRIVTAQRILSFAPDDSQIYVFGAKTLLHYILTGRLGRPSEVGLDFNQGESDGMSQDADLDEEHEL